MFKLGFKSKLNIKYRGFYIKIKVERHFANLWSKKAIIKQTLLSLGKLIPRDNKRKSPIEIFRDPKGSAHKKAPCIIIKMTTLKRLYFTFLLVFLIQLN